jgi:PKD repeat protein
MRKAIVPLGVISVSLTVTNPWGSDIEEKTDLIVALRGKSMPWISLLLGVASIVTFRSECLDQSSASEPNSCYGGKV